MDSIFSNYLVLIALALVVVISILINWLISSCFYDVAEAKGFPKKRYFWMSFFFGFIGWFLVLALPDRGNTHQNGNLL